MKRVTLDFELPADSRLSGLFIVKEGAGSAHIEVGRDGRFASYRKASRHEFTDLQSAIDFALGVERKPLRWWRTIVGSHLMLSRGLAGEKWKELAGIYRQKHAAVYKSEPGTGFLIEFDLGTGHFAERRAMLDCMDALVEHGVLTADEADEIMAAGVVDAAETEGGE